jgi:hypothetical protein
MELALSLCDQDEASQADTCNRDQTGGNREHDLDVQDIGEDWQCHTPVEQPLHERYPTLCRPPGEQRQQAAARHPAGQQGTAGDHQQGGGNREKRDQLAPPAGSWQSLQDLLDKLRIMWWSCLGEKLL